MSCLHPVLLLLLFQDQNLISHIFSPILLGVLFFFVCVIGSPGWPGAHCVGMHYVDKTGFDHTDLIASAFPVLGLKVGTIMPGLMDTIFIYVFIL